MAGTPSSDGEAAVPQSTGGLAARAQLASLPSYLQDLNPEQRQAVETVDGPVLVLAGAGTGKTRVLTTRIAHLLATRRASPGEILAVTFTNKAAREMRERIGTLIGGAVEGMPWLGTFHSTGVKMLRRHAELVDLKSGFTILDTDDQIRLLKQLLEAENIDDKRWPARQLAGFIDRWKNRGWTPADVPKGESFAYGNGLGAELYDAYQVRLKALNAVDFGDLLLECIRLFRENPEVLSQYHRRFRYILVDEYQDTNVAQYLWLRLLAQGREEGRQNVCCVGDDDQSIYCWRGAEVDNILRFEKDFEGAAVIRLERNYRSTSRILSAASHLIAHNESRLGKTLFTDTAEDGEPVKLRGSWDSQEEARAIADDLENLERQGHRLNGIAILVRASSQMREFEDRFITNGINYRVIGGPRFYERAEIRDALAYLRVTAQPSHDLAFERIINTPRRGLGDQTVRTVRGHARAAGVPLFQAAALICETEELKPKPRKSLRDLVEMFARWRALADSLPHTALAEQILDESGYTEMWQRDRSPDAQGRLDNLKELVRSMEEFENLEGFLEHVSLIMDTDTGDGNDKVSIMTLHSAKGLEFDTVFLPGWEDGLFPSQRSLDETGHAGLEEERRLAYVGLTRARKRAVVTFASNRRIHGLWQSTIPSRFIDELPEAEIAVEEGQSYGGHAGYGGYGPSRFDDAAGTFSSSSYTTPGWQRAQQARPENRFPKSRAPVIDGELVASSIDESGGFEIGERVFHIKFGYGAVAAVDGNKLTVDFEKAGRKRVLGSFLERH